MRAAGGSPGPSGRASITTRSVALVVAGGVIAGESAFLGAKSATRRTTGPVGQLQDVMHEHREEIEALKRMQRDAFHEVTHRAKVVGTQRGAPTGQLVE